MDLPPPPPIDPSAFPPLPDDFNLPPPPPIPQSEHILGALDEIKLSDHPQTDFRIIERLGQG